MQVSLNSIGFYFAHFHCAILARYPPSFSDPFRSLRGTNTSESSRSRRKSRREEETVLDGKQQNRELSCCPKTSFDGILGNRFHQGCEESTEKPKKTGQALESVNMIERNGFVIDQLTETSSGDRDPSDEQRRPANQRREPVRDSVNGRLNPRKTKIAQETIRAPRVIKEDHIQPAAIGLSDYGRRICWSWMYFGRVRLGRSPSRRRRKSKPTNQPNQT